MDNNIKKRIRVNIPQSPDEKLRDLAINAFMAEIRKLEPETREILENSVMQNTTHVNLNQKIYNVAKELKRKGFLGNEGENNNVMLNRMLSAADLAVALATYLNLDLDGRNRVEYLAVLKAKEDDSLTQEETKEINKVDNPYVRFAEFATNMTTEYGPLSLSIKEIKEKGLDKFFAEIMQEFGPKSEQKTVVGNVTEYFIEEWAKFNIWRNSNRKKVEVTK